MKSRLQIVLHPAHQIYHDKNRSRPRQLRHDAKTAVPTDSHRNTILIVHAVICGNRAYYDCRCPDILVRGIGRRSVVLPEVFLKRLFLLWHLTTRASPYPTRSTLSCPGPAQMQSLDSKMHRNRPAAACFTMSGQGSRVHTCSNPGPAQALGPSHLPQSQALVLP